MPYANEGCKFFSITNPMFCQQTFFHKGLLTHTVAEYKNSH